MKTRACRTTPRIVTYNSSDCHLQLLGLGRATPAMKLVELSTNNHIVEVNSHTTYCKWDTAQARPISVSDVSRSLQG